jgi:hypothetical protein
LDLASSGLETSEYKTIDEKRLKKPKRKHGQLGKEGEKD